MKVQRKPIKLWLWKLDRYGMTHTEGCCVCYEEPEWEVCGNFVCEELCDKHLKLLYVPANEEAEKVFEKKGETNGTPKEM